MQPLVSQGRSVIPCDWDASSTSASKVRWREITRQAGGEQEGGTSKAKVAQGNDGASRQLCGLGNHLRSTASWYERIRRQTFSS